MVDKKKSSGSGCDILEIARSPLGIFSCNDKQSSPSEEREGSKEVQESKGNGIFLVGGHTGEDCLPYMYLTDGLKSRVRHWLIMNHDLEGSFVFLWEFLQLY